VISDKNRIVVKQKNIVSKAGQQLVSELVVDVGSFLIRDNEIRMVVEASSTGEQNEKH
jgi:hypothetical protein